MPMFVGFLVSSLLGGLRYAAGSLAVQFLIGIGVGVVTYTGMDISLTYLKQQAVGNLSALPAQLLGLLGYMKVGVFINIVTSAMAARLSMTLVRTASGALAAKRFFKL